MNDDVRKATKISVDYVIEHKNVMIKAKLHRNKKMDLTTRKGSKDFVFKDSDPTKAQNVAYAILHAVDLSNQEEWN